MNGAVQMNQKIKNALERIQPKPEDFENEEEYLEARDGFRARAGFLLRPKFVNVPLDLTNLPFDPVDALRESLSTLESKPPQPSAECSMTSPVKKITNSDKPE